MLDADWALVFTSAAGRALPQHFLAVNFAELPRVLGLGVAPGEQRLLGLQDDPLGIQRLARAPRRAIPLAAATLDAGERVEPHLALQVLDGLQPDLLLLEIEVR